MACAKQKLILVIIFVAIKAEIIVLYRLNAAVLFLKNQDYYTTENIKNQYDSVRMLRGLLNQFVSICCYKDRNLQSLNVGRTGAFWQDRGHPRISFP